MAWTFLSVFPLGSWSQFLWLPLPMALVANLGEKHGLQSLTCRKRWGLAGRPLFDGESFQSKDMSTTIATCLLKDTMVQHEPHQNVGTHSARCTSSWFPP
eukprot:2601168-Amphidinium_carterae.2